MGNSEKKDIYSDVYENMHRLDKRMAAIDEGFNAFVANKAFNDYFEFSHCSNLLEHVVPSDAEALTEFITSYRGNISKAVFKFRNRNGDERYNLLILEEPGKKSEKRIINIEMIDIESSIEINEMIIDDIAKTRMLLGISDEYTFSYNRNDNIFYLYRYDQYKRTVIFKSDIESWKQQMIDEGFIAEADINTFKTMVSDIKSYSQSFSVKLNTSIRTKNDIKEELRFSGLLYGRNNRDKTVIGRIMPEKLCNQQNTLQMIDQLNYDSLTKVYNKKTITEYAIRTLREEKQNMVTIVIMDVDHFKSVNDTYGHLYGDKVLSRVGSRLIEIVGEDGVVGRIGGDEFMIVLNGINDEQMLRGMLRSIRTQIKWEFADDFEDFIITCSIGAAVYPINGNDYEELFKKADYCLYIAKEKGRDRYVYFRDELHRQSYEESIGMKDNAIGNNRELKELKYIQVFMEAFNLDKKQAVNDVLEHMLHTYKLDSINIYYGEGLRRLFTVGQTEVNSEDAMYARSEEFRQAMLGKSYLRCNFVGNLLNTAPSFCDIMKKRRVFSTVQCILGTPDDIKGLVTFDKCKEASQWADYEIECAVIFTSFLNVMFEYKYKK